MKILVLSDSHGNLSHMEQAVEAESPDTVLHLGDRDRDAQQLEAFFPKIPVVSVPGNCDYPPPGTPLTRILEWDGVRIWMCHGHPYGVKRGLLNLELAAREAGAQVAVFGHTHRAYCEEYGGLWMMNPGACGGARPSYGVIDINRGTVRCSVKAID